MFGPDPSRTKELSSVNAVVSLSVVLSQSNSPRQVIQLATTAVPSIVRCRIAKVWHPKESGEYFDRAPEGVDTQLAELSPAGGAVRVENHAFGWAYPLSGPTDRHQRLYLVLAGDTTPTDEQRFLLTVLAQLCGTVIAKAELYEHERAQAEEMAQLAARLESTVSTLTKVMDTHRQLNEVAASDRGEVGIAEVLHRLCGLPVVIQDAHGNTRASAGPVPDGVKESPEERKELIRVLANLRQAVYRRGAWMVLANPHIDVRGVIALIDPERRAGEADLAALEYAATVLSMELARLRSIAEIELRTHRDFAEELLAGAEETAVKATAHVLGYDAQRPHRAIIVTGARRTRISDLFLRAVNRQVRAYGVATLVVGRSDCVIVMAHQDMPWAELASAIDAELPKETCRLAVGSRYPNIWEIHHSYREAQFVADLSNSITDNFTDRVLLFEELGIYRILSSVSNLTEVERFMKEKLSPLIEYDNDHKSALVLTLARYFDCGCKYDETADRMNIHRSTLKYRLQRIRELTGYDLTDGSVRFDLHLATRIWLTLEALSGPGPTA